MRAILPTIAVPTLVVHDTGDETIPFRVGEYLAEHIPARGSSPKTRGSHLGRSAWLDCFPTSRSSRRERGRPSSPIGSCRPCSSPTSSGRPISRSRSATTRGGKLLDRHDEIVRREINRCRGQQVKHTGDGVLAVSTDPPRGRLRPRHRRRATAVGHRGAHRRAHRRDRAARRRHRWRSAYTSARASWRSPSPTKCSCREPFATSPRVRACRSPTVASTSSRASPIAGRCSGPRADGRERPRQLDGRGARRGTHRGAARRRAGRRGRRATIDGRDRGPGAQRARADGDPTAHAEILALRDAAAAAGYVAARRPRAGRDTRAVPDVRRGGVGGAGPARGVRRRGSEGRRDRQPLQLLGRSAAEPRRPRSCEVSAPPSAPRFSPTSSPRDGSAQVP